MNWSRASTSRRLVVTSPAPAVCSEATEAADTRAGLIGAAASSDLWRRRPGRAEAGGEAVSGRVICRTGGVIFRLWRIECA